MIQALIYGFTTYAHGRSRSVKNVVLSWPMGTTLVFAIPHATSKSPNAALLFAMIDWYCLSGQLLPGPCWPYGTGYTSSSSLMRIKSSCPAQFKRSKLTVSRAVELLAFVYVVFGQSTKRCTSSVKKGSIKFFSSWVPRPVPYQYLMSWAYSYWRISSSANVSHHGLRRPVIGVSKPHRYGKSTMSELLNCSPSNKPLILSTIDGRYIPAHVVA